ncbi:MAG: tetratricopeptide repeat protein [Proteobacteria bacterium]|nr:tetratricopeptide repeat protein [Pseudomonadota bacterium]
MDCSACSFSNREGVRYCTHCGTPLFMVCVKCSTPAQEGDQFCGSCGFRLIHLGAGAPLPAMALAPAAPTKPAAPAAPVKLESERKNVTVLFADIAGFTAMSEKLDPEDVTNLMNGCLRMLADVVVRYEGYVDKFIGDCVMAIFGAPIAHENHPELAVRAALAMHREMEEYNKKLPTKIDKKLALHTGINTGMVIAGGVGSDTKMEYTVMGDTVNLASRLESIAKDGQIFVSGYTYNLTRHLFEFIRHDPIKVKGKQAPVAVYEVTKAKSVTGQEKTGDTAPPLVGRSSEIDTLQKCAQALMAGHGQAVFLISEPGIGKSRVQLELKNRFKPGEIQVIEGSCRSFSRSTSYAVFAEIFKALLTIDADDLPEAIRDKLVKNLPLMLKLDPEALMPEAREAIVHIGSILGLKLAEEFDVPVDQMEAQEVKASIFRSVAWFYRQLGKQKPVMLVLENLHHADTTSIELVAYLFDALRQDPMMLVLLMRPVKDHPSAKLPLIAKKVLDDRSTQISFSRLSDPECDQLLRHLLKVADVPDAILAMVRSRADGNPLYIEEIARSLVDDGIVERTDDGGLRLLRDLDQVSIPGSIQGLVMARIDKLPTALKDVLQVAAVLGPTFKHELLKRVVTGDDLEARLGQLIELGIVFESKSFPEIEYSFRNVLTQEAIHSTLLLSRQKELHKQIATEIEGLYASRLDDHVELLAQHYVGAAEPAKAYQYLLKSGLKAKAAYANQDAARYFSDALEQAEKIQPPPGDLADVQVALSEVQELQGDMEAAIQSLHKAAGLIAVEVRKADVLRNIGRIEEKRGSAKKAAEIYVDALKILANHPDAVETGMVYMNQSWVMNRMRQSDQAIETAMKAVKIFEAHGATEKIALAYNNIGVFYEHKGDFDKAFEFNKKSLDLFTAQGDKRQMGNLFLSLGYLYNKKKDLDVALDYFEQSFQTMDRIGNRFGAGTALMSKGRCYVDLDKLDEAERSLAQALRIHRELDLKRKMVANELALGNVLMRKDDLAAARKHAESAYGLASQENYGSDLARACRLEADLAQREGQDPTPKLREAITILEGIGRTEEAAQIAKQLARFASAAK